MFFQEAKIDFDLSSPTTDNSNGNVGNGGAVAADEAALPDLFDSSPGHQQHPPVVGGVSSGANMPSSSQMAANATNIISSFRGGEKRIYYS